MKKYVTRRMCWVGVITLLFLSGCTPFIQSVRPSASAPGGRPVFNIEDYGALSGGKTLATEAIQKAVDACAESGGGLVYVPAGEFLTAPIFLKSNINFHLSEGATLLGSQNLEDYPPVGGRWEGIERKVYASMFTGHNLKNVSITGRGTLDGQGEVWWKAQKVTKNLRKARGIKGREPDNPPDAPLKWPRPRMINLYNCENILIRDITILNSPSWTVHPVYCKNVTIDNVTIIQPYDSPNTDGINPDSCEDVRIINCYIDVGDDCITLKSGYNEDGRRVGKPCENIVITNCTMAHGHGGVVVGSEMSGDVRNVAISNCVFDKTKRGLRLKTKRGRGGVVEGIRATNIVMRGTDIALSMTMHYSDEEGPYPVTEETPTFRNIHYSDITITGARSAGIIEGIAEMPIQDISLTNVYVGSDEGLKISNAKGVLLNNVIVNAKSSPALMVEDVSDIEIDRFRDPEPDPNLPVIEFENVAGAFIQSCTAVEGTGTFLELKGESNREIRLSENRLSEASKKVEFTGGASEGALIKPK